MRHGALAPERSRMHVLETAPRLSTLLLKCEALTRTSQPNSRRSTSCAFAWNSWPQPFVEPTLSNGVSNAAVDDGARLMFTSASVVFLLQNVYSKCSLLFSSCASNPDSSSAERSGLRFALPGWFAVRPG